MSDAQFDGRITPRCSFVYDGKPSDSLLKAWKVQRQSVGSKIVTTFSDPETGLVVEEVTLNYDDFPTVELEVFLRNEGTKDTPIIEKFRAIDTAFVLGDGDVVLHYNTGDKATPDSYEPHADLLVKGEKKTITAVGGRPTQNVFPYFNFAGKDRGVIVAIGWPGQWSASYSREDASVHVTGGQELTHFKLRPGESGRGPCVVVQSYRGDWIRGQNLWRRWMVKHNMPRPEGKPRADGDAVHGELLSWAHEQRSAGVEVHQAISRRRREAGCMVAGRGMVSLRRRHLAEDRHVGS